MLKAAENTLAPTLSGDDVIVVVVIFVVVVVNILCCCFGNVECWLI